ncbi:unnamed protein product [Euphydryas editha]|uniref:Uncharacterized protein n=1 Tax=Euphydryas editha TaxID=104508 RepID=A0AAU9UW26_EUPED|nr:unnamed protein product [Euphydryas editha]
MSLLVVFLKDLITILILIVFVIATPINNGLIVKINPVYPKEEVKAKSFNATNKNPQELKSKVNNGIISQAIFPKAVNSETSCTNQVTKILFPSRAEFDDSELWVNKNFINIPIIEEKVNDYTIIVAKAPKKFRIGRGHKAMPVIVYIVFPNDDPEDLSIKMPLIYFVTEADRLFLDKNHKFDPVIMINSNRTTTGLKSNNVFKFVKFKNKLRNSFD